MYNFKMTPKELFDLGIILGSLNDEQIKKLKVDVSSIMDAIQSGSYVDSNSNNKKIIKKIQELQDESLHSDTNAMKSNNLSIKQHRDRSVTLDYSVSCEKITSILIHPIDLEIIIPIFDIIFRESEHSIKDKISINRKIKRNILDHTKIFQHFGASIQESDNALSIMFTSRFANLKARYIISVEYSNFYDQESIRLSKFVEGEEDVTIPLFGKSQLRIICDFVK